MQEPEPIGTAFLIRGESISEKAFRILIDVYASVAIKVAYPNRHTALFILKNPEEETYRVVLLTRKEVWASDPIGEAKDALILFEATLDLETTGAD